MSYTIKWLAVAMILGGQLAKAQSHISVKILNEPDLNIDWMRANLDLSDAQARSISLLNTKYEPRFDSIRRSSADRYLKFQKAYRVIQDRDYELKRILSDKQFALYQRRVKKMYAASAHKSDTTTLMSKHYN